MEDNQSHARAPGALRCLGLGVLGAASASVLAACGQDTSDGEGTGAGSTVKGQAISAFVAGTWAVAFPLGGDDHEPFEITVSPDGKWTSTQTFRDAPVLGTWAVSGDAVKITGWRDDDAEGTGVGLPESVDDGMGTTVAWTYSESGSGSGDGMTVPISWKADSKTLTISAQDANGENLQITATRKG